MKCCSYFPLHYLGKINGISFDNNLYVISNDIDFRVDFIIFRNCKSKQENVMGKFRSVI